MITQLICKNNKFGVRNFFTNLSIFRSHYDSLGITPKATQSDIKAAYYKLSKVYHPDKNKGSIDASKKFQDISSAYEVLGNFKLRRLYDKGLIYKSDTTYAPQKEEIYPEHPHAKFYESRQTQQNMSSTARRVYDFDEWSRAHYGATFERTNRAKKKWEFKQNKLREDQIDIKNEKAVISILSLVFVFCVYSFMFVDTDLDNVKPDTRK